MYYYEFLLTPSKPQADINYTQYRPEILAAVKAVNDGLAFTRDGKGIDLAEDNIKENSIKLTLHCKTPLVHAARSLSALTRNLTGSYPEIFSQHIYNKTLFRMELTTQSCSFDDLELTDTDLLKGVIDLLFTHTTTTKAEAELREQTISQMKTLIKPYIKN